jgi:hypothetical protein
VRCAPAHLAAAAVIAAAFILTVGGAERSDSAGPDPIRIGAVFSETGGLRSIGSPGLAGMRLAAAEITPAEASWGGGCRSRPPTVGAGPPRSPAPFEG